jgi:3-oxoacyl-[acyl-carrier-protein] synthase II
VREVAVTGVGFACALGAGGSEAARELHRDLRSGKVGLRPAGDVRDGLPYRGFGIADIDVAPLLKRRKDRKLLPRCAELAIVAAAAALGEERPADIGCFFGVGREPSDPEETEAAILASERDGRLDTLLLATRGLAAYPPLAPLRTLPNLILAHVAIQLDLTGECATRAGEESAGFAAIAEGFWAIAEGRADVVLAGGAESRVDLVSARDRLRIGDGRPPGEGAALLRLEALERAQARGARVWGRIIAAGAGAVPEFSLASAEEAALGALGCAAGPLAVVLALSEGRGGRFGAREASGASAWVEWSGAADA